MINVVNAFDPTSLKLIVCLIAFQNNFVVDAYHFEREKMKRSASSGGPLVATPGRFWALADETSDEEAGGSFSVELREAELSRSPASFARDALCAGYSPRSAVDLGGQYMRRKNRHRWPLVAPAVGRPKP